MCSKTSDGCFDQSLTEPPGQLATERGVVFFVGGLGNGWNVGDKWLIDGW